MCQSSSTRWLFLAVVQCLEADELLSSAGVSPGRSRHLSVADFMHVCPILIVQLDSHVCTDQLNDSNGHSHGHGVEPSPGAGMSSVMFRAYLEGGRTRAPP